MVVVPLLRHPLVDMEDLLQPLEDMVDLLQLRQPLLLKVDHRTVVEVK